MQGYCNGLFCFCFVIFGGWGVILQFVETISLQKLTKYIIRLRRELRNEMVVGAHE